MKTQTIKQKILVSFIFIILLYFTSSVFIFFKMYDYNSAYDRMLVVFSSLNKISEETTEVKKYMLTMNFKSNIEDILEYEERYQNDTKRIDNCIANLPVQEDNIKLKDDVDLIVYKMDTFKESIEIMIDAKKTGDMSGYVTANEGMKESAEYIANHVKEVTSEQVLRSEEVRASVQKGFNSLAVSAVILFAVILILSIIYMLVFSNNMSKSIVKVIDMAKKISKGNLSVSDLKVQTNDETSVLADTFSHMKNNLKSVVGNIVESSYRLAELFEVLDNSVQQNNAAVGEIAESINSVNKSLSENSVDVEKTEDALQKMKDAVGRICTDSVEVGKSSTKASSIANDGNVSIGNIVEQINVISTTVDEVDKTTEIMVKNLNEIEGFLELISSISRQTNMLSLNASIEAAKAGKYGAGFTVVADEIRKLAGETASASDKIANIIKRIQGDSTEMKNIVKKSMQEIKVGLDMSDNASASFNEICKSNETVENQINSISGQIDSLIMLIDEVKVYTDKVISMIKQTYDDSAQISAAVEEQYSGLSEISETSSFIKELSEKLKGIVSEFEIN